jgi:hypothetical protein
LIKSNTITYGACLAVAAALWFLNALNKEYVTEITYPVRYGDLPRGKMLVSDMPREITLEIKAHGFALLRHKLSTSLLPVVFNVNSDLLQKSDILEKQVNTAEIKERIAAQFNSDVQLLHVKPESIFFKFSRLERKKIPVVATGARYSLHQQYILKSAPVVIPDSVIAEGPASVIDTLRAAHLASVHFPHLARSVARDISLVEIPGVQLTPDEARLEIEVERHTGGKKNIPVVTRGLPADLYLRLFPSSVEVTYNVGLSRYEQVLDSRFVLSVDYREAAGAPGTLEVKVEQSPDFIDNLTLSPDRVEYLVEQK